MQTFMIYIHTLFLILLFLHNKILSTAPQHWLEDSEHWSTPTVNHIEKESVSMGSEVPMGIHLHFEALSSQRSNGEGLGAAEGWVL